jgi:hypothetical protein
MNHLDQATSNERAVQYIETEIAKCDRAIASKRDAIERAHGGRRVHVAVFTDELQIWLESRERLEEYRQDQLCRIEKSRRARAGR